MQSKPLTWKRPLTQLMVFALTLWLLLPQTVWAKGLEANSLPTAPTNLSVKPYLDRVAQQITEFTLNNGLKFIVLERHKAPVVSFLTYADVGGADEPTGQTGIAHFLEHLAFKGTRQIGTRNYTAEQPLLDRLDTLFQQIQQAQQTGDQAKVQQLQAEFSRIETEAKQWVVQNEMGQIVNQSGGVGLNATTSADATRYFYSFPSNKLELWMSLESERFLDPVFREFYKEKEVILEERRMRTDNSPIGKMVEVFLDKAFTTHPYRRPVIGYPQDLRQMSRPNVEAFFKTYYGPSNLTMVVVGDVNPTDVKRLANLYFGRFPTQPKPPQVTATEPPQTDERSVTVSLPSQPWYLEGYHRPALRHPDNAAYELMTSLLSDGRTSRLYKALVEEQQVALNAEGQNGFPGDKYPNLLLFYALTAPGHTVEEVATALNREIERLKTEPVSATELERVQNQARASLLRSLASNDGMARLLAEYEIKTGSWRNLFRELEAIAAVTPADLQRVAQITFVPTNRTVGKLLSTPPTGSKS
ncbi:MAG: pitrilysin family protein [Thermosynechococcaceae cyanobacterium]